MDILFFSEFIELFVGVCKHFKVSFADNYVITMWEDGTWRKLSYEQFKTLYVSSFIETLMSCDEEV